MGFWDQPYPGQPIDPGLPPGYDPIQHDPLIAAMLAQKAPPQPSMLGYDPASLIDTPGALPLTSQDQASRFMDQGARAVTPTLDSLGNALSLPGRALYGPESAGWERYGEAKPEEALNAAGWVAVPGLGRAAMAAPTENALGIFGGRLAKTADQTALTKAEQMAAGGAEPDAIWNSTGWFQGADKKWRFEIPDTASRLNAAPQPPGVERTMGGTLSHDPLYEAYPQLKDVGVDLGYGAGQKARGAFMGGGEGEPFITAQGNTEQGLRSTLLHEAQHGIQSIEGFAKGGNPSFLTPGTPGWDIYQQRIKAILDPGTLEEFAQKAGFDSPQAATADYAAHVKTLQGYAKNGLPSWLDRSAQDSAAQEAYRRSAGEVEARNVQTRLDKSTEDLRDIPPWYSQDVQNDQQIIRTPKPGEQWTAKSDEPASGGMLASEPPSITAYHGSPHDFDKFDYSKIGTGEGAQAYGHGLYFAGNEGVAQQYRDALSARGPTVGVKYDGDLPYGADLGFIQRKVLDEQGPQAAIDDAVARMKDQDKFYDRTYGGNSGQPNLYTHAAEAIGSLDPAKLGVNKGSMYQVQIHADPEHFLDWDKPLSQQSPKVQEAINQMAAQHGVEPDLSISGSDAYHSVANNLADPNVTHWNASVTSGGPNAAEKLRDAGIPGIKYLDAGSRNPTPEWKIFSPNESTAKKWTVSNGPYGSKPQFFDNEADARAAYSAEVAKQPPRTSNYVTFSDDIISILKKYGLAGLGLAGYGAAQSQGQPQAQ